MTTACSTVSLITAISSRLAKRAGASRTAPDTGITLLLGLHRWVHRNPRAPLRQPLKRALRGARGPPIGLPAQADTSGGPILDDESLTEQTAGGTVPPRQHGVARYQRGPLRRSAAAVHLATNRCALGLVRQVPSPAATARSADPRAAGPNAFAPAL